MIWTEQSKRILEDILLAVSLTDQELQLSLRGFSRQKMEEEALAGEAFRWMTLIQDGGMDREMTGKKASPEQIRTAFQSFLSVLAAGEYTPEDAENLRKACREEGIPAPPRKLYIADCHFYDKQLCSRMDMRPFPDGKEMNRQMIRKWNEKVRPQDDVYILGDFSVAGGRDSFKVVSRLTGHLHLIAGNHDHFFEDVKHFPSGSFMWVRDYEEHLDGDKKVILCHYPIMCYKKQYARKPDGSPCAYMLYGHVHNTQDERLLNRFIRQTRSTRVTTRDGTETSIPCNMINCFCMFSDYQPMTLEEWIAIDSRRRALLNEEEKGRDLS